MLKSNLKTAIALIFAICILSCKKDHQNPDNDPCIGQPVFSWSKDAIISDGLDKYSSYALAADNMGNVYIATEIQGTVDADPGDAVLNLTGPGVVVQKLDLNGILVWAKEVSSPAQQDKLDTLVLIVDPYRNVFLNATYQNENRITKFNELGEVVNGNDPQYGIHDLLGVDKYGSQFLIAYDTFLMEPVGDIYVMNRYLIDGPGRPVITDLKVTNQGNFYILGLTYSKDTDFDPGSNEHIELTEPLVDDNSRIVYLQKFDAKGNFLWVKQVGLEGIWGYTLTMLVDNNENVYINRYDTSNWRYNFLRKIAKDGSFVWEKEVIRNGAIMLDGSNIYAAGYLQWERYNASGELTWSTTPDAAYRGYLMASGNGHTMYSLYPETKLPFDKNNKVTMQIRKFEFCGRY